MQFLNWHQLRTGQQITIVKLDPMGAEAARYSGEVVGIREPESWCIVRAIWAYGDMSIDGLVFHTGDLLLEWFSPICPFNAFAVYAPEGEFRGWYANVSDPALLEISNQDPTFHPTLKWHDRFLDLIGLTDGSFTIRDRNELQESGISATNPPLYQSILAAEQELVARFLARQIPFHLDTAGSSRASI